MFNKKKNKIIELEKENKELINLNSFRSIISKEKIIYQTRNITEQHVACIYQKHMIENINKEQLDFNVRLNLTNELAEYLMSGIESYKTEILPNGDSRFYISVCTMIE